MTDILQNTGTPWHCSGVTTAIVLEIYLYCIPGILGGSAHLKQFIGQGSANKSREIMGRPEVEYCVREN